MRIALEQRDEKAIFKVLRREGRKDAGLYVQVLRYFVQQAQSLSHEGGGAQGGEEEGKRGDGKHLHLSSPSSAAVIGTSAATARTEEEEEERWDAVSEVLSLIEQDEALPHAQVLAVLSTNPDLPLHIVSRYVKKALHASADEAAVLEKGVVSMSHAIQQAKVSLH